MPVQKDDSLQLRSSGYSCVSGWRGWVVYNYNSTTGIVDRKDSLTKIRDEVNKSMELIIQ